MHYVLDYVTQLVIPGLFNVLVKTVKCNDIYKYMTPIVTSLHKNSIIKLQIVWK